MPRSNTQLLEPSGLFKFLIDCQKKTVAESASSYSHLTEWRFHPECFKTAESCSLTLLAASGLGITPLEEESLKKKIATICEHRKAEGQWSKVAKQLMLPLAPLSQALMILGSDSPRTLFSRKMRLISIYRGLKRIDSYAKKRTRVITPQRKRGYDDKGHLRSSSLSDIRYWKTPTVEVPYSVNGTTFIPDWYDQESKTSGGPVERNMTRPRVWPRVCQQFLLEKLGTERFLALYGEQQTILKKTPSN